MARLDWSRKEDLINGHSWSIRIEDPGIKFAFFEKFGYEKSEEVRSLQKGSVTDLTGAACLFGNGNPNLISRTASFF
jgi:hypothetical protein